MGSPPHTRGTQQVLPVKLQGLRITPAYAGNTNKRLTPSAKHRDHPRIRGEHVYSLIIQSSLLGSPPHTRGTLRRHNHWRSPERITPAYAGNTLKFSDFQKFFQDHPRIRGEHQAALWRRMPGMGSPPHTRGTLVRFC